MSRKAHVIDGEASESDPEDVQLAEIASNENASSKPFVIPGEAPESDEDDLPLYNRSMRLEKSSDGDGSAQDSPSRSSTKYNSLLHQKLNESNINLRLNIERLLRNQNLLNKLTESDKALLNDQELLRSASANINISLVKLKEVKNVLDRITSGNHLSNVKMKNRND